MSFWRPGYFCTGAKPEHSYKTNARICRRWKYVSNWGMYDHLIPYTALLASALTLSQSAALLLLLRREHRYVCGFQGNKNSRLMIVAVT